MRPIVSAVISALFLIACGGGTEPASPALSVQIKQLSAPAIAGDQVQLSASQGQGAFTYAWQLSQKPPESQLQLGNTQGDTLEFRADVPGIYAVTLTVRNASGSVSVPYQVVVAANQAPVIKTEATTDYTSVVQGETLRIDAHQSRDPEQRPLTYRWTLLAQPPTSALSAATTDYYDFAPTIRGNYQIELAVSDGYTTSKTVLNYQAIQARTLLNAKMDSELSAVQQVAAVFGAGSSDLPQTHASDHLTVSNDAALGASFQFKLHLAEDGDRAVALSQTDRQRSEIKTYANSPATQTCEQGETLSVFWQLKTEDIGLSYSFSHLFQIKGQDDQPLLTLTARRVSATTNELHLLYGNQSSILASVDWGLVKQRWLDAALTFTCSDNGNLRFSLIDTLTQQPVMTYQNQALAMWQGIDNDKLGLKFGLYRKVKVNSSDAQFREGLHLREDNVYIRTIRIEQH